MAKGHLHHTWYILKGSFVVFLFSHGLPEGAPFNIFCESRVSTGTLGQLELLLCLLRKVRKRKQTLQERAEDIPLLIYSVNTWDRNTGEALLWACMGQVLLKAVAALQDPFQIAQQRLAVGSDSLWMWKVWFRGLHGNHIFPALFPHTEMCGLCPSLQFVLAWCCSCFGLRLRRATWSAEVAPKRPWQSTYKCGDKQPSLNLQGSFLYCLLELAQPSNWGHWAP